MADAAAGGSEEVTRLLAACLNNDEEAWLELFSMCYPCAKRVAMAPPFLFSAEDAEDIVQEALVDLYKAIKTVRSPKAFISVAAHNKCVDRLRKKKIPLVPLLDLENLHGTDALRPMPVDLAGSPAVVRLRGILTGIQERWSELLYLRYFEELEYAAIGERLGMPTNQVGVYLTRALATLRDEIKRNSGLWEELRELFL